MILIIGEEDGRRVRIQAIGSPAELLKELREGAPGVLLGCMPKEERTPENIKEMCAGLCDDIYEVALDIIAEKRGSKLTAVQLMDDGRLVQ